MKRVYRNESSESIVARELLEVVWYDNGGLAERTGQFTKFKKRLQRILKKLPREVFDLFLIEEYKTESGADTFIDTFAIGDEFVKNALIGKYPELKDVDDLLNEWFDG